MPHSASQRCTNRRELLVWPEARTLTGREIAVPRARAGVSSSRARGIYSQLTVSRRREPTMNASPRRGQGGGAVLRALALGGGCLGLLGGCAPDDELPLPPVVWEGESVRVRMDDPGIQVCGGSFEALDRHAELVRVALLLEGDGIVEYSIGDREFVDERCSDAPIACTYTDTGAVFTSVPFIRHEIVHSVRILDPHTSLRSLAIEEGLATAFGSDDLGSRMVPIDAMNLFEDPRVGGSDEYYRAGYLMALLLERHDVERFRVFDLLARGRPEGHAFEEAFGETKADFAVVADAAPLCDQSQWWAPLLECDGEPMTADPASGRIVFNGNLRCDDAQTFGPEGGIMWSSLHIRLDAPTSRLRNRITLPDDATLEVVGCSGGCPTRFAYIGKRNQVSSYGSGLPSLEPGEYYIRVIRPVSNDDDGWFEIVLE
jgi:hypothetical protein